MFKKNPWGKDFSERFGEARMKFSKNSIIILLLITVIIVISYFNFSSGNYLKVLEKNMTSLKTSLEGCKNEISSLKNDFQKLRM